MATNNIGNHKHLTLADQAAIEHGNTDWQNPLHRSLRG